MFEKTLTNEVQVKKFFKSKKIYSFVLALIMVFSVFFFSACTTENESEFITVKVVYKPFSTSRPSSNSDTYGEIICDSLIEVSRDVLTRLVGEYGIGEVSVKDGASTKTVSPDLKGINFKNLLNLPNDLSAEDTLEYVKEFLKLTNAYYFHSTDVTILVLSNYSTTGRAPVAFESGNYVAKQSLTLISGSGTINNGESMTPNNVYKYNDEPNQDFSYIFVGGGLGENNYKSIQNAQKYIFKFFNTHFNAIQKTLSEVPLVNEQDCNLVFTSWEHKLEESDGNYSTSTEFLNKYVQKYEELFAVETAKRALVGEGSFDSTMELMYTNAKNNPSQRRSFLETCSEYIDHLYLSENEVVPLSNFIYNGFIGISEAPTSLFFKNYASLSQQTVLDNRQNFVCEPVLEYQDFKDFIEGIQVEGYIQSIIIFSNFEFDLNLVVIETDFTRESLLDYYFTLRHCQNGNLIEYPLVLNEEYGDSELMFEIADATFNSPVIIENYNDILSASSPKSTLTEGTSQYFTLNSYGSCWVFNNLSTDFAEIAFYCHSPLHFSQINIEYIFIT